MDARQVLERLCHERGQDYASLSRLIGRNSAYIQQFIRRGTPRRLPEAIGGGLDGVLQMRHLGDADALAGIIAPGARALVVGGGYIGLEAAAVLRDKGQVFVGIDVIGDWLTEINVTSPTGLQELERFDGTNAAALIWEAIERRRSQAPHASLDSASR